MRTSKFILGIAAGVAAGVVVGLLLAPESGEETRKRISKKSQGLIDDLKTRFGSIIEEASEHIDNARKTAQEYGDKAKEKASEAARRMS